MIDLPTISVGDPAADAAIERWRQAILFACNVKFNIPLKETYTDGGRAVTFETTKIRCIGKITGANGDGSYSWSEAYGDPATPGGWIDVPGGMSGTLTVESAWEANLNASVTTGSIVWMEYDKGSQSWRFATGLGGMIFGQAQAGIAAGDMGTPASGTVHLCVPSGGGHGLSAGTATATAYNFWTASIPTNALCLMTTINGDLVVVAYNCTASA